MNRFPDVKCKFCGKNFETQIKIDPAIYKMVPNIKVGSNNFTCPHCNRVADYSEEDFRYTPELSKTLHFYGKEINSRNIILVEIDDPINDERVEWSGPLITLLIQELHKNKQWEKITPREFEEIVAELFKGYGYSVELTKRTRDGGRDVIAINRNNVIIPQKYLIECKHWKDKVGVSVVRELLGVSAIEEERPSGLIVASTSGFTKDALLLSEKDQAKWILSLKDKEAIEEWVKDYVNIKINLH